jgi:hypothetical protein
MRKHCMAGQVVCKLGCVPLINSDAKSQWPCLVDVFLALLLVRYDDAGECAGTVVQAIPHWHQLAYSPFYYERKMGGVVTFCKSREY